MPRQHTHMAAWRWPLKEASSYYVVLSGSAGIPQRQRLRRGKEETASLSSGAVNQANPHSARQREERHIWCEFVFKAKRSRP